MQCFTALAFSRPSIRSHLNVISPHPTLSKLPVSFTVLVTTTEYHPSHLFIAIFFLLDYKLNEFGDIILFTAVSLLLK